jgi:hypothetical protein
MANIDSVPVVFDSKWRNELKVEIIALIKKRHPAIDRGLQFEGVTLDNPNEKSLATILVLQEIVSTMREFSLVQWAGGIALVRTGQVEKIDKAYQEVNENANYIIRGGTEKAGDLLENAAVPTGKYDGEQ